MIEKYSYFWHPVFYSILVGIFKLTKGSCTILFWFCYMASSGVLVLAIVIYDTNMLKYRDQGTSYFLGFLAFYPHSCKILSFQNL